jgi:hypothetical protein
VPRRSSPDQLDMLGSAQMSNHSSAQQFGTDDVPVRFIRQDGPSTSRMQMKHQQRQVSSCGYEVINVSDSDSIEEYRSDNHMELKKKTPTRMQTPNRTPVPSVNERKKNFERKPSPVPRINLATMPRRRQPVKNGMKAKGTKQVRRALHVSLLVLTSKVGLIGLFSKGHYRHAV